MHAKEVESRPDSSLDLLTKQFQNLKFMLETAKRNLKEWNKSYVAIDEMTNNIQTNAMRTVQGALCVGCLKNLVTVKTKLDLHENGCPKRKVIVV